MGRGKMKRPEYMRYPATWDGINDYLRDMEAYCDHMEDLLTCSQVLTGDDAERFAAMIQAGLNKPSGPAPTPKLDQARATMRKRFKNGRMADSDFERLGPDDMGNHPVA